VDVHDVVARIAAEVDRGGAGDVEVVELDVGGAGAAGGDGERPVDIEREVFAGGVGSDVDEESGVEVGDRAAGEAGAADGRDDVGDRLVVVDADEAAEPLAADAGAGCPRY
jgi:hypothetical protein